MKAGVHGFVGARLKQAREAMGLSVTSLADLVGVSKQAISQYEKGADFPGQRVFDQLAALLGHEPQFFLSAPKRFASNVRFYRSMAAATKSARTKAEVRTLWVRELVSYVSHYIELPKANFPRFDIPSDPTKIGMDRVEIVAAELREFWRLGNIPIADLVNVAELNGIVIVRHSMDAETLDGLSEWLEPEQVPLVVLNSDKGIATRSRLDLAHEIGHLVLHRGVSQDQLRRPEIFDLIEAQAFRFGAAFLLPEDAFLEDLYSASLDALRNLKLKWKVSVAMMIERLKVLGIITDEQHRRLRINYSTRRWNRVEPLDAELAIERPIFLAKALRVLVEREIQTTAQIVTSTGLSSVWIQRLIDLPKEFFEPRQPDVKVLEFKRRA